MTFYVFFVMCMSGGMCLSMSLHTVAGSCTGFVRHILSVPLYVGSMMLMPFAIMVLYFTILLFATISV